MPTEEERAHAVQQLAMFMQARDARDFGLVVDHVPHPTWEELVELDAHQEYVDGAAAIVAAMEVLGWAPRTKEQES